MPRRIEIELTSTTPEGAVTWRAAGAKQPKGVLDPSLLPSGVGVGATVKAEIETGLDGVDVIAVFAPEAKAAEAAPVERIEILGSKRHTSEVSVTYAPGGRRRRGDDTEEGGRSRRPSRPGGDRKPRSGGERRPRTDAQGGAERKEGSGPRREPRAGGSAERRDRRPALSTVHRNALLATLGPHELPIAEQLLRGGLPAVRQALAEQSDGAANADAVIALAETLLPRINVATWKDRAASAQAAGRELRLRELRAVVTAARNLSLDDDGKAIAKSLQELLDQRVTAVRTEWLSRLTNALDAGKVAEAVRTATRTPDPGTRLPAELAVRLSDAAGAGLTTTLAPDDWNELLNAVIESPVRRTVKPTGIPDDLVCQDLARKAAGSVPALAKLLGLPIPPPPPRRNPTARRVVLSRSGE